MTIDTLSGQADVTEDSATWEDSYEADVLPQLDGWTAGVTNPAYVSVSDGILSYDTMQVVATGGATTDGAASWSRPNPGFDFAAGASIETRIRLNGVDSLPTPPAGMSISCVLEFGQATDGMWVNPVVQTLSEVGYAQRTTVPLGTWTTIRVVAKNNLLSLLCRRCAGRHSRRW